MRQGTDRSAGSSFGIGSILLNKCTGETWLLLTHKSGDETKFRWYVIKRDEREAGFLYQKPPKAR
jgi:hypothetical protein